MAHRGLGFMQLAIACGFALFYAWYLIAFFGLFITVPAQAGFTQQHIGQILFFCGGILSTNIVLAHFRRANSVAVGHARYLYLLCLVPGSVMQLLAALDCLGVGTPLPAFYLLCFISGTSLSFGFMQWEDFAMHGFSSKGALAHGAVFCAGGVIFIASMVFLLPLQLAAFAEVLLCLSMALLAFIASRFDAIENRPVEPVRDYFRKSRHLDAVVIAINIAFGFAFIMLYRMGSTILLAVMGIAICADFIFALLLKGEKWLPLLGMARISAALIGCALLLYVCPGTLLHRAMLCVICALWVIFRTINGSSLVNLAIVNGFSTLYASTRGKMAANAGFTAGLAIGVASLELGLSLAEFYVPLAIVSILLLTTLFLLPFDDTSRTIGYKTIALVDVVKPQQEQDDFDAFCEKVTQLYKLSPRESEALVYVVKGRNAKHIAEKLFISESTAKTHISNIYRKTGVHSQQELLDKLDTL